MLEHIHSHCILACYFISISLKYINFHFHHIQLSISKCISWHFSFFYEQYTIKFMLSSFKNISFVYPGTGLSVASKIRDWDFLPYNFFFFCFNISNFTAMWRWRHCFQVSSYNTFFMINSGETKIYPAHKC